MQTYEVAAPATRDRSARKRWLALAVVTALFPVAAERVKALAIWGALSGLGFAVGILLGGAITQAASWRWVFLINVPIAVVSLVVIPRLVPDGRVTGRRGFDLWG